MSEAREYQGYKRTVNKKSGREMWFFNGKLTAKSKIPENVINHFNENPEKKAAKPVDKETTNKLYGYSDETIVNDSTLKAKQEQEAAALKVLKDKFPEFNYEVEFEPALKTADGVKKKAVYRIYVLSGTILEKIIRISEFNVSVIKQNIDALFDGWKNTGRRRAPRKGETIETNLGEGRNMESTHVREVKLPRL